MLEHDKLYSSLGIETSFVQSLFDEQKDLQFIVTLAIIIEGATAKAVTANIKEEKLSSWILKRTQNSNRLDLLGELDLLRPECCADLKVVAKIRNGYAHYLENIKSL